MQHPFSPISANMNANSEYRNACFKFLTDFSAGVFSFAYANNFDIYQKQWQYTRRSSYFRIINDNGDGSISIGAAAKAFKKACPKFKFKDTIDWTGTKTKIANVTINGNHTGTIQFHLKYGIVYVCLTDIRS